MYTNHIDGLHLYIVMYIVYTSVMSHKHFITYFSLNIMHLMKWIRTHIYLKYLKANYTVIRALRQWWIHQQLDKFEICVKWKRVELRITSLRLPFWALERMWGTVFWVFFIFIQPHSPSNLSSKLQAIITINDLLMSFNLKGNKVLHSLFLHLDRLVLWLK